jgi:hypothetical protein
MYSIFNFLGYTTYRWEEVNYRQSIASKYQYLDTTDNRYLTLKPLVAKGRISYQIR